MQPTIRRITIGISALIAIILVASICLLCFASRVVPPVQVSFLGATNDPSAPLVWGVFRIVNNLDEPLRTPGGIFAKWDGQKWSDTTGSYYANFGGEQKYAAGTTNIACTAVPRQQGRYTLIFRYYPSSMTTPKFYASPRYKLLQFFVRKGLISARSSSGKVVIPGYYQIEPKSPLIAVGDSLEVPGYEQSRTGAVVRVVSQ